MSIDPTRTRVHRIDLPREAAISGLYPAADLADAYAVALGTGEEFDALALARLVFNRQPGWVSRLLKLRDMIVRGFGLKTSHELRRLERSDAGQRINIFKIFTTSAQEVVLGEDDTHLDFRVSVLVRSEPRELVVTTVVHCHNLLGRIYIAVIGPFHRLIVRSLLRRAARRGWAPGIAPAGA